MRRDRRWLECERGIGSAEDSFAINGRNIEGRRGACEENCLDCERETTKEGATHTQAGSNLNEVSQMNVGRMKFFRSESIPISRGVTSI